MEIMTDSELGISEERMQLFFYNSLGYYAGGFNLFFSSIPWYWIQFCTISLRTNFPTDLPAARNKIWRITLTKTSGIRLQIHCNNVEVLNILLSDTTCGKSDWSTYWNREIEKIRFGPFDSVSDYYRLSNPGKQFIYSFIHPSVRPSVRPSVHPSIHPSIHPYIHLFMNLQKPKTCV